MNAIDFLQLSEEETTNPPIKVDKKPLFEPAYVPIFTSPVNIKKLRSQIMVDTRDPYLTGSVAEGIIRHNLTLAMLKELESHIKIEKMQEGFSVYGQTMFVGKLDVVERREKI